MTLETGATDAVVNYSSGSGTSTLTFTYTVAANESSADLDYVATTSLALNSGTIKDGIGNNAVLTLASPSAAGSLGANKALVITDNTAPTVSNVTSSMADGTYGVGSVIPVQVVFSEAVTVTGTPQLTLETGATDAVVNYSSGSGTSTLTFTYTVAANESSADLDYVATGSLALNSGTIVDVAGNSATLTLASPGAAGSLGANKALVIETTAPTVTNVTSSKSDGTYGVGEVIPVQVVFSEAVTVTGTPQLTLETGATDAVVNYSSGSGTSTLVFNYTVAASESSADLDYAATTSLALNSGTIKDGAGNNAVLTLASPGAAGSLGANKDLVLDTTAPTVTNVTSSTANGTFGVGGTIAIQVVFSKAVTVTGSPQLVLDTSVSGTPATYSSGAGTNTLVFDYTVIAGDNSSDLDYKATSSLGLNGGTIKDAPGNNAVLTLATPGAAGSLGANKAFVVDTTAPTSPSISINSGADYTSSNLVDLALSASGSPSQMYVTNTAGCASGGSWEAYSATKLAWATTGSSNTETVYAKFKDAGGNETSCVSDSIIRVPEVQKVTSSNSNGVYALGQTISVRVVFNTGVAVTGTPTLTLSTGYSSSNNNQASCSTTTATTNLSDDTVVCSYTVAAGHNSSDLDYASTSALALSGGTIQVKGGSTAALLTLPAPASSNSLAGQKNLVVDTAPIVTNVTSNKADGSWGVSEVIPVQVTFSENISVTGTPRITLETGANDAVVDFSSVSGNTATFNYTVAAGQHSSDLDYVATSSLVLNGGTIKDQDGSITNAVLTLPSPGATGSLGANKALVIATPAQVVGVVTTTGNGPHRKGATISVAVQFTEAVTVNSSGGTPYVELATNSSSLGRANYSSGTGTTTLVFNYSVALGESSSDLDYNATDSLKLNGGTIKNGASDANLTFASPGASGSISDNEQVVVDPLPEVTNVTSSSSNGLYDVADTVSIQVVFTEPVTVTGSPKLEVNTSSGVDAFALYNAGASSGSTVSFTYTVGYGDTSIGPTDALRGRLEYTGTGALNLNGGSIVDANETAGNADITLPAVGGTGSLATNKSIRTLLGKAVTGTDVGSVGGFGSAAADAGDLDSNSRPEVIIGSPLKNGGGTARGEVNVLTDAGAILYTVSGSENSAGFGSALAGGYNVDGASEKDYLVGAPQADGGGTNKGQVFLYEGTSLLRTFTGGANNDEFGTSVALLGDLNGDSKSELAIGAPGADAGGTNRGAVYIYDGDTGTELVEINGVVDNAQFGQSIANAGDVDGDGLNDLVIGAPNDSSNGADAGRVFVYKGSFSSSVVGFTYYWELGGEAAGDHLGTSVAKAGLVNADAYSDVLVGAPDYDSSKGRAYVLNGTSGAALYTVTGDVAGDKLGYSVAGLGDRNGDSKAEFIVGAPFAAGGGTARGIAKVYNGGTGAVMNTLTGANNNEHFGKVVAGIEGDVDGDGTNDFVVGAPDYNSNEGRGHYYR